MNYYIYGLQYYKTDNLNKAIEEFKRQSVQPSNYLALGVEKNNKLCCDILIKDSQGLRISNDYKQLDNFKNDKLITVNLVNVLYRNELQKKLVKYA